MERFKNYDKFNVQAPTAKKSKTQEVKQQGEEDSEEGNKKNSIVRQFVNQLPANLKDAFLKLNLNGAQSEPLKLRQVNIAEALQKQYNKDHAETGRASGGGGGGGNGDDGAGGGAPLIENKVTINRHVTKVEPESALVRNVVSGEVHALPPNCQRRFAVCQNCDVLEIECK